MSTFIFDLDGTLYREHQVLPGAIETVNELRGCGHAVLFCTNDGTRTRSERAASLNALGIPVQPDELMTSAYATACYLRALPTVPKSVLVIGSDGLIEEIKCCCPDIRVNSSAPFDAVIVSFDPSFSYDRLADAQHAVLAGAYLIATNRDPQYPGVNRIYPGAGSLVAAVETACLTTAYVVGKPSPFLYDQLIALHSADPQTTIVVGDSMLTDIAAAAPSKLYSVLVLTGVTKEPPPLDGSYYPQLVLPSVQYLIPALQQARPDLICGTNYV